ncbi:MAG: type I polyketide synthase [Deltaproteobacteria bacterium]
MPQSPDERIVALLRDARQQLELERNRREEPIAIVGIGCRFPGGISSPTEFWKLLRAGIDASGELPGDRWSADAYFDSNPEAPGKTYTRRGSFLEHIDGFDADFFGISPREARGMDPQQRLLLEVVWEALEDGGIAPERIRGTATGVWVGLCVEDYARRSIWSDDPSAIDAYSALGNTRSVAAGRISYVFDLRGPTVQLDTACSSSLVAIHQACQSLRARECNLALAGGVNLMSAPESTIALCKLRALSPDGRCKTFDAAADGYGRGEGCAVVALKRLSDARAAGDRIHAVVRGSAVNHDGHSNGLTAPNGLAQEAVLRAALANAGVEAADVSLVEAHGTGTLLGDPIEVLALGRVYGANRAAGLPLQLGTVKTNFGHLEGAAGVAGLIKLALCLRHGELVPNLHFRQPNPKIPWSTLPVQVVTAGGVWPCAGKSRLGGVSSFGISGTNAHVVVEEAPGMEPSASLPLRSAELVVLSAKTNQALSAAAGRLRDHLEADSELALADVASSLVTTRSMLEHRLALSVSSRAALVEGLRVAEAGETPAGAARGPARETRGKLAWLLTGQGAQQLGMGRELYGEWPVFREALDEVCALLDAQQERPLREVMWAQAGTREAALLEQTGYTQPALFAFEWALSRLWRSWGVVPDVLLGHSIGELTAACIAGVFSLSDAARLVCARARLMQALPKGGAMVSIAAPEAQVTAALPALARSVSIAAVNGPSSTVISGVEADVLALAERFSARGVATKRLSVSHAFHSPLMEPMLTAFEEVARSIAYQPPHIPIVSDTLGRLASSELCTAQYWVRHVRDTVRFTAGVQALSQAGADTFLELGPKPTLLGLVPLCLPDQDPSLLASLRPSRSEVESLFESLGGWVVLGGNVDWTGVFPGGRRRVELPTYPWQRQRYWINAEAHGGPRRSLDIEAALHGLINRRVLSGSATAAIPEILSALAEGASPCAESDPNCFYRLVWQPADAPVAIPSLPGRWQVVVFDDSQRGEAVVSALAAGGAQAELVPLDRLGDAAATDNVLCIWERAADYPSAALSACRGLAVVQALFGKSEPPRLWWVTREAVSVSAGEVVGPASATLWGLGRTLMWEYPELQCTLIDIDESLPVIDVVSSELALHDSEDQVAWRSGHRQVARLIRQVAADPSTEAPRRSIRLDGTVLVTGGLGALGLAVATSFAQLGAQHLLLTGRRGMDTPDAATAISKLEALGSRVTVASADVSDCGSLARVLLGVPEDCPLRVVVHAAGIIDDGMLSDQTAERFASVLAPKAGGAWNLHQLTQNADLDAFVLFSSLAGTLGSAGQANYAAANAYLDSLAAHRRALGLAAQSLAWGPWGGTGMAASLGLELQASFRRQGIGLILPRRGVRLFHAALERSASDLLIADIAWEKFGARFANSGPRKLLAEVQGFAAPIESPGASPPMAEVLAALPRAARKGYLRDWIAGQVAAVLGHEDAHALSLQRGFFDLGMDSLMVVELRRRVEKGIGRRLSTGVAFSHPNIEALAEYLAGELIPNDDASPERDRSQAVASTQMQPAELENEEDLLNFINSRFEAGDEHTG